MKLKAQQAASFNRWGIYNYPVSGQKTRNLATIRKQKLYGDIDKINQQYIRTVSFEYTGSHKFGNIHLEKVLAEMEPELPLGYRTEKLDRYWWWNSDQGISYWLILLVFVIIYFICAILFESLLQPLAVIAIIPLSFIGVFLTFYIFDLNFDQGGYASFILLCGLTVNSVIYIVNELNNVRKQYKHRKMSPVKLYVKAFNGKIVPVLLTILSTILGLIPFLIGGQNEVFWFALAAGTIGGLVFSIVVLFIYLPMFFVPKKINT